MKRSYSDTQAVENYMRNLIPEYKTALEHIRSVILSTDDRIVERITYNMPIFRLHKDLVGISAASKHLSFFITKPVIMPRVREIVPDFTCGKATIQFSPTHMLPDDTVKKIIGWMIADQESEL